MLEKIKTNAEKYKYLILLVLLTVVFVINFTFVLNQKNDYQNTINKLYSEISVLDANKANSNETIVLENKLTEVKNVSLWLNIIYTIFIAFVGVTFTSLLSTWGQWLYTNIKFTKQKQSAEEQKTLTTSDNQQLTAEIQATTNKENYSHVLAVVYLSVALIVSVSLYITFQG